ncbi:MAG TPA: phosphatase PAP2 family protein [Gaiellaceae bacterium]|nr:phosphatase PAP2 family protein [Gaiellaceae bacterium]
MPAHDTGVVARLGPALAASARRGLLREAALVALAILLYFGIRNATAGNPDIAFANAEWLLDVERALGLAREGALQGAVAGSDALVALANWVYIWGHWPVILTAAAVLYVRDRRRYVLLRNALFVSGALGFLFFALFPVAPPRLLPLGLVDTVTEQSHAYRALQPPGLTNQYAAFPSLHVGWNLLVGVVVFAATTSLAARAFAVASPLAMAFAVVATANHFVVDVAAGAAVVLVGLGVALAIQRRETAATLVGGDSRPGRSHPRRPSRREPARGSPRGGAARGDRRGGRAPLPRPAGGAPPEDGRPAAALLGPLAPRGAVAPPAPAGRPARGGRPGDGADARPEGPAAGGRRAGPRGAAAEPR